MKIEHYIIAGLFIMLWLWNMARRKTPRRKDKLECLKQFCDALSSSLNTGYPLNGLLLGALLQRGQLHKRVGWPRQQPFLRLPFNSLVS